MFFVPLIHADENYHVCIRHLGFQCSHRYLVQAVAKSFQLLKNHKEILILCIILSTRALGKCVLKIILQFWEPR
jgi:hypothetical protein